MQRLLKSVTGFAHHRPLVFRRCSLASYNRTLANTWGSVSEAKFAWFMVEERVRIAEAALRSSAGMIRGQASRLT
jgi:hypothetical protein